jgi:hypothetical protein
MNWTNTGRMGVKLKAFLACSSLDLLCYEANRSLDYGSGGPGNPSMYSSVTNDIAYIERGQGGHGKFIPIYRSSRAYKKSKGAALSL